MDDKPRDIIKALDANRFREIGAEAVLGGNFWLSLSLAAQRGDRAACQQLIGQIITLTRATNALLKRLGTEDVSRG